MTLDLILGAAVVALAGFLFVMFNTFGTAGM